MCFLFPPSLQGLKILEFKKRRITLHALQETLNASEDFLFDDDIDLVSFWILNSDRLFPGLLDKVLLFGRESRHEHTNFGNSRMKGTGESGLSPKISEWQA